MKLLKASFNKKKTNLILANGSERGDFVPLKYIFEEFSRIHDGIQMMKTYYPYDNSWTTKGRISDYTIRKNVSYAWDYEYDDYHPFDIFEKNSQTTKEMEQIISYGSDLHLTLTIDVSLPDDELIKIIQYLRRYGRVFLRINHEANGAWFSHNTRNTYREVNDFFVRFHHLIKSYSTNIYTVFSLTGDVFVDKGIVENGLLGLEPGQLKEALNLADYWSVDKYVTLHYGWPFSKKATKETGFRGTVDDWWRIVEETYLKMIWHNNFIAKPLLINEFNADSDINGYENQASIIREIYQRIASGEFEWLKGVVMYQFRDYAGLGLEKGDLKKHEKLPGLDVYRDVTKMFLYDVILEECQRPEYGITFSWMDSGYIRGIKVQDFNGTALFHNLFEHAVFLVFGLEQNWARVEPKQEFLFPDVQEFFLFIPPYLNAKGEFRFIVTIDNVEELMEKSLMKRG